MRVCREEAELSGRQLGAHGRGQGGPVGANRTEEEHGVGPPSAVGRLLKKSAEQRREAPVTECMCVCGVGCGVWRWGAPVTKGGGDGGALGDGAGLMPC